jgi:hypothetical protein
MLKRLFPERDYCYECGHKETWREARRHAKMYREWAKRPPDPMASIFNEALLNELRPFSVMKNILDRSEGEAYTFVWPKENDDAV